MDNYIEINGNRARLFGNFNQQLLSDLDLELSYKLAGVEYSPAVKAGRYDGRTRLLTSNLTFSVGLVNRVVEFFKENNIEVKIIDNNTYKPSYEIDILDRLKKINKIPRDYQIEAAEIAVKNKMGILRLATGAGKSLLIALIIAKVGLNKKANVFVIGKSLLWQFYELFEQVFPGQVGIIGDGEFKPNNINICSIWTIGVAYGQKNRYDEEECEKEKKISQNYFNDIRAIVSDADISIMDEVHMGAAATFQAISKNIYSEYRIGVSATPAREDRSDLLIESIFSKIIYNLNASELIARKFLTKPIIKFVPVPKVRFSSSMNYKQIYSDYVVNNEDRNNIIIKGAKSLIEQDFYTVILFRELAHGKILYDKLTENKIDFHVLSGKDSADDRSYVIDQIMKGKCKLVLASSIFNVGVDCARLSGLINASGGKSRSISMQKIGRSLRVYEGKDMSAVIDFYDQCRYLRDHSIIRYETYKREPGFEVKPCKEMIK